MYIWYHGEYVIITVTHCNFTEATECNVEKQIYRGGFHWGQQDTRGGSSGWWRNATIVGSV
jgi:hypothetical protein